MDEKLFTSLEIQLIRSSLANKTDGEIAAILERDIDVIRDKINEITNGDAENRSSLIALAREKEAADKLAAKQQKSRERQQAKLISAPVEKKKITRGPQKKEKTPEQLEAEIKKEQRRLERDRRMNMDESRRVNRGRSNERKVFKTRKLDLSNMIKVKIDHKTTVYVKPGTDIEKVKELYTRKSILIVE